MATRIKRVKLKIPEKRLLQICASELIPRLSENAELAHLKQPAFDYYDDQTKQVFQVQVTVTRYDSDFLDPFQTEEMTILRKKKR